MRPWTRRLGVALVSTAGLATALPAAPVSAADPLTCTASASISWTKTGKLTASITAYVSGSCSTPAWTTCDISLSGLTGVLASQRTADYGWCSSSVTFDGLLNTPYAALGQVGYSAEDGPNAAAVAYAFPTTPVTSRGI